MLPRKILLGAALSGVVSLVLGGPALAQEKIDGFVCPVFNSDSQAGAKNPKAVSIGGGDSTVIGPKVSVPVHATNGDGAGTPGGAHSSPGDRDYTAVWSG